MRNILSVALVGLSGVAHPVLAQTNDCSSYPLSEGTFFEEVEGGLKIFSTASAEVMFDDRSEVQSAMREAQLYAEAAIAEFLNKQIQSEDSLDTAVATQVSVVGDTKEVNQERLKVQLRSIRTEASALLSGVAPLGSCYTAGEYVMFTVGVKPSTIQGAAQMGADMAASVTTQQNASADNGSAIPNTDASKDDGATGTSVGMKAVTGFSNTGNLKNF